MRYKPLTNHNIMEVWAYDACNFRCGYCALVTNGDVTRVEQLAPFRDDAFIDRLVGFFAEHRPKGRPWAVLVTGGEPFMMPNLDRFVRGLGRNGDCSAFYTNNSLRVEKVLSEEACSFLSYVQCSFHPDWHMGNFEKQTFFDNVAALTSRGIPTLVRFVGAPPILDLLDELQERSLAVGAGFLPTTLFAPNYPKDYSTAERARLAGAMSGFSSQIQLEGGLKVTGPRCWAADRLFAVRLHQGGDITPCISTAEPVLGNIFQNRLEVREGPNPCFKADGLCSCDIHFQQNVIDGVDDSDAFARIVSGEQVHSVDKWADWKTQNAIETSDAQWVGQGVGIDETHDLLRVAPKVSHRLY